MIPPLFECTQEEVDALHSIRQMVERELELPNHLQNDIWLCNEASWAFGDDRKANYRFRTKFEEALGDPLEPDCYTLNGWHADKTGEFLLNGAAANRVRLEWLDALIKHNQENEV